MPREPNHTSVKEIALDVATAIVLVIGAIAIAWLRQFLPQQQLPSVTEWILRISEITLLMYFLVELVKACRFFVRELHRLFKEIRPHVQYSQSLLKRLWGNRPKLRLDFEFGKPVETIVRVVLFLTLIIGANLVIGTAIAIHPLFGLAAALFYFLIALAWICPPWIACYWRIPSIWEIARNPIGWIMIGIIVIVVYRIVTQGIPDFLLVLIELVNAALMVLPAYSGFLILGLMMLIYAGGLIARTLQKSTGQNN